MERRSWEAQRNPEDDRYSTANSSDTEAELYTAHFEKRCFVFNPSESVVWDGAHPDVVEKCPPI